MKFTAALLLAAVLAVSAQAPTQAHPGPTPTECSDMLTKTDPRCGDVAACVSALEPYCERMPQQLQYRCAGALRVQQGALHSLCTAHGRSVDHIIDVAGEWSVYARSVAEHNEQVAAELLEAFGGPQTDEEVAAAHEHADRDGVHHPSFYTDHPNEYVRRNAQAVQDANDRKARGESRSTDTPEFGLVGAPQSCVNMPKTNPSCDELEACAAQLGPYCATLPEPYKKQCKDGDKALKGVVKQTCK